MRPARFLGIMVRCRCRPRPSRRSPGFRFARPGSLLRTRAAESAEATQLTLRRTMNDGAYLYILRCADDSYYTGTARSGLEQRVAEHNAGTYGGYTAQRRPVTLVFSQWFDRITDAIAAERQVKGWSRAKKKEALIRGDFDSLARLSTRRRPLAKATR